MPRYAKRLWIVLSSVGFLASVYPETAIDGFFAGPGNAVAVAESASAASGDRSVQTPPTQAEPATFTHQGREIPNTVEEILNPKHTALLVHEMLNDFISPGGAFDKRGRRIDASGIMAPIAKLLAAARARNVRVIYVKWTNYADNSTSSDPRVRSDWARLTNPDDRRFLPSTVEHTWGWEIPDEIKPLPGDWVLRKYRPDAFFGTPLDAHLRWNGIKTLAVVGIGAEVGVVPTVLTASNMGYFTAAVSDALRPTDPKTFDDAMKYIGGPAILKTHTELIDLWEKSPRFDPTASAPAPSTAQNPQREPDMLTYQGRQIPNTVEAMLNPKHTALIVHEMLNDFISEGGGRPAGRIDATKIIQPIANLLAAARAKNVRVGYVRWTRHADRSTDADQQARTMRGKTEKPYTVEGTWGWDAPDAIKPVAGEWIIRKYRTDAFFSTPLDTLLRWNGIKTIVIVGIGAEAGIVPTLMHASNLGYFNVAASDGIGPSNPARIEDAMRFIARQGVVKTTKEIIDIWRAY